MIKYIISVYLLVIISSSGAPSISSISGTLTHGEQVTISGDSFGTKASASPIVWDNFESGTNNNDISGNMPVVGSEWTSYVNTGGSEPKYSTSNNKTNSSKNAYFNFNSSTYASELLSNYNYTNFYFTFYIRISKQGSNWSTNYKPFYIHGNSSGNPTLWMGDDGTRLQLGRVDSGFGPSNLWTSIELSNYADEWIRLEGYYVQSSAGSTDGSANLYLHRPNAGTPPSVTTVLTQNAIATRNSSNYWRQFSLGSYNDTNRPMNVYIDDVYLDNTQARIEIGDASTWADCTHREIQPPTAWSDGEITVTANEGSFDFGVDTLYLFVIDSDGVISSGYELNSFQASVTGITGLSETNIVNGGDDIVFTLTGTTWVETLGEDNEITTAFLEILDGSLSGAGSWDDEVTLTHAHLVRTSDTVLTLTLPASAGYNIGSTETISIGDIPASATEAGEAITPSPNSFTIAYNIPAPAAGGGKTVNMTSDGPIVTISSDGKGKTWIMGN